MEMKIHHHMFILFIIAIASFITKGVCAIPKDDVSSTESHERTIRKTVKPHEATPHSWNATAREHFSLTTQDVKALVHHVLNYSHNNLRFPTHHGRSADNRSLSKPPRRDYCYSNQCICNGTTAICKNGNLTYLPPLPKNITKLMFQKYFLPNLSRTTFKNISNLKLTELKLTVDNIKTIEEDSFIYFKVLKVFSLSGNKGLKVSEMADGFKSLPKTLERLVLSRMYLHDLDFGMFQNLRNSSVKKLILSGNHLISLNDSVFLDLPRLKTLDLSASWLHRFYLFGHQSLEKIRLDHAQIVIFPPYFCWNDTWSKYPKLKVLSMRYNHITLPFKKSWSCLHKLEALHLDGNIIETLTNNAFNTLTSLKLLSLKNAKTRWIKKYAFNNTSLKTLNLDQNSIYFPAGSISLDIFKWCPNLSTLHIGYNRLDFPPETLSSSFQRLLWPLENLSTLVLEKVSLKAIPGGVFSKLKSLQILILNKNYITDWHSDPTVFADVHSLKKLALSANKIAIVNPTSFPLNIRSTLTFIDLSYNPFVCDCNNLWFRNWMKENTSLFNGYSYKYFCSQPPEYQGKALKTYNPTALGCQMKDTVTIVIIILAVLFLLSVVVGCLLYKYRWDIRYRLYLFRVRKKGYEPLSGDSFAYDAFVVYAEEDRQWVTKTLLPHLEREHGYKLFITDRDSQIGKPKIDDIVDSMMSSRKVITVLSQQFVQCEWCLYQLNVAQHHSISQSVDWVVPVIVEDLDSRHMKTSVHQLLSSSSTATWTENEAGQQLFWEQLRAFLQ